MKNKKDFPQRPNAFEFNGRTFVEKYETFRGMQGSPFADGTGTNNVMFLRCLEDDSSIRYNSLMIEMIHRYGFYEGHGTPYRLDPREIAEMAGLVPRMDDAVIKVPETQTVQDQIEQSEKLMIKQPTEPIKKKTTFDNLGRLQEILKETSQQIQSPEQIVIGLPDNLTDEAKTIAQFLINNQYALKKIDVSEFISQLDAKAQDLKKEGQENEQPKLTENEVLSAYAELSVDPAFRDFISHPLVTKNLAKKKSDLLLKPVEAMIDPDVLATLPEIEYQNPRLGLQRLHQLTIGDQIYTIDKGILRKGDLNHPTEKLFIDLGKIRLT